MTPDLAFAIREVLLFAIIASGIITIGIPVGVLIYSLVMKARNK